MKKQYLSDRLREIQKEIYRESWEKYKSDFTMTEMAQVFRTPINNFFRIARQDKEVEK
jgi:hypothetical protein